MKSKINHLLVFFLFALLSFTACQDEETEVVNPNEQEAIAPNSALANLIRFTTANFGAADDILDGASCFSIELPVTIVVSDITVVIETESDLEQLENLFDDLNGDDDFLDFVFPITIIFSDYTELVIENEDELENFINECEDDDDSIDCVDFVYPISFSVFNSEFNLIDTVSIANDEALYQFLDELEDDENAIIVSLNYPVTLEYANGETITVNTNQELADAIEAAGDDCDDDDETDCDDESIELTLKDCQWELTAYSSFPEFQGFLLEFNSDNTFGIILDENQTLTEGNTWSVVSNSDGSFLVLDTDFEDLGGDWQIVECDDDRFEFTKNNQNMIIEQVCEGDLECSVDQINANIIECGWKLETNLIDSDSPIYVFFSPNGQILASNDAAAIQIGTWEIVVIASQIFIEFTYQQEFQVLNGQWQVEECEDDKFYLINGSNYIELDKACITNDQELLECVSYYVLSQECDTNNDGIASFVFEVNSTQNEECIELYSIVSTSHPTYEDAVNNTNLLNIPVATPLELESQIIYFRIFSDVTQAYAVQEVEIEVEPCEEAVFDCFDDFEIVECESPNNVPVYNLSANTIGLIDCSEPFTPSFHATLMDAENDINPIVNTEAYGTLVAIVYLRIEAESGNFEIFNVYLNTEACNLFECFQSFDAVIALCDTGTDGPNTYNLQLVFDNCEAEVITYHTSLVDAQGALNAIVNPSVYETANMESTIYARVEINNQFEVFPIQLIVTDCDNNPCPEEDVDNFLLECIWNASNYNGSDSLVEWNFDFESTNQIVIIYTDDITIDATWSTSQSNEGVIIEFSNVGGPNIQAISGAWLVVECGDGRFELNRGDDVLVLERNCD